jgi:hypothetical protein
MGFPKTPELEVVLARASERRGLQVYYRDCVRPLLGAPMERWPRCCGSGCEPCAETLIAVARDVYEALGLTDATAQELADDSG